MKIRAILIALANSGYWLLTVCKMKWKRIGRSNMVIWMFLVATLTLILYGQLRQRQLKINFIVANGFVLNGERQHIGWTYYNYSFQLQGNFVFGKKVLGISSQNMHHFENRYFPVIVSKKSNNLYDILILPEDFAKYGLPFPDSLKWVKKYMW